VSALSKRGLEVAGEEYALKDGKTESGDIVRGAQLFGLLRLKNGSDHPDYQLVAGLRNSHDKSLTAGLALGSSVFVCDNLAFSGEVTFARKHTSEILSDLPCRINTAINRVKGMQELQDNRIEAYKDKRIGDNAAMVAIMKAASAKRPIIAANKTVRVWEEWKQPRHDAFKPRTVWSLFNSFTEVMKAYTVIDRVGRTQDLHQMMDKATALSN